LTVLALVDPNSLVGAELRQGLRQRRQLWHEVRLLGTDVEVEGGTLSELDGAALVKPLTAEQLADVDLLFVSDGFDEASPPWADLSASATTVLIGAAQTPADGIPIVSGINLDRAVEGGLLVSPHPAVVLLALLLDPLRALGLTEAAAWLVQPATVHGRAGMDELMNQTRALLAFQEDRPTSIFGQQLSFNLLPTLRSTAALATEIASILNGDLRPAIEIVQGAVFHSFTASLLVGFGEDPGAEAIAASLDSQNLLRPADPAVGAVPIAAAGSNEVLLGAVTPVPGHPGRYWVRAAMDNLTRGGALNALEIAEAVLSQ
jgi:aspartate-semialdehyde dehydrogenase